MSTEDANNQLIEWLQEAHAIAKHGETMLAGRADHLDDYPRLRDRMREHVTETREHGADIAAALARLGADTSTAKNIGGKLSAIGHSWGTQMTGEQAVQSLASSYAFEHFEIANYRALIVAAETAGQPDVKATCEKILEKDLAMAQWLGDNLTDTTRGFLERGAQ